MEVDHLSRDNSSEPTRLRNSSFETSPGTIGKIGPTNKLVTAMLTDMYQITMTYAYWKAGRQNDFAVFDLFFRKNPFKGEFCIFAGLDEVLGHLAAFKFTPEDVEFLKTLMPHCEEEFWEYMMGLDCSEMVVYAQDEGSLVFPREPLLRVEGPLAVGQLLETTLLNLVNFPSLVATNAARMRLAAGSEFTLLEFGLRRAQGPDGGVSASKYAYVGGFDGTSNVQAAKLTNIACKGTHAHAFVMCYTSLSDIKDHYLPKPKDGFGDEAPINFVELCKKKLITLDYRNTNEGELAAFIAYAQAFPDGFLALVDTFDTLNSGTKNFLAVAAALYDLGYQPIGVRLDSGDLAYLSKEVRKYFKAADAICGQGPRFEKAQIVASNDINEAVLLELTRSGHEIDAFGIGTHLVTCQAQPALGCVYKLVEVNQKPRIKLSQEPNKLTIPCRKNIYRLYGKTGEPIMDVIQRADEEVPREGQRMLCRHPFQEQKRAHVVPTKVEPLLKVVWNRKVGITVPLKSLDTVRDHCKQQLQKMRSDHIRPINPTPYKVAVSPDLYDYMHQLWMTEAPIAELQ
jgi:nicotinate phosphoribosyltransferase